MTNVVSFNQFNKDKEDKIEALTSWLDEQAQWAEDYISHVDNINNYAECFESHSLHYGEIDEEIRDEVKTLLDSMGDSEILDYCNEPDINYGYSYISNEIWSISIGETEHQFSGVYNHETKSNCIYTDLCEGLSENDIKEAQDKSDCYISDDCLYIDNSYDRVSIVLDVDRLLKDKRK